jgi:hypothetical protein
MEEGPSLCVVRIFCILELFVGVCCLRELVIDEAAEIELADDGGVGAERDLASVRWHRQHRAVGSLRAWCRERSHRAA